MAKSLRASSKVKARNARRYNPNTDYAVTQAARLHAISQRLQARIKGPSVTDEARLSSEDNEEKEEQVQDGLADGESKVMDIETDEAVKKISTSGPRMNRRETWRKARGWKPKQGTKNGGKPKRRR